MKKTKEIIKVIAPSYLEFYKDKIAMGNTLISILMVTQYPSQVDFSWLANTLNTTDITYSFISNPISDDIIIRNLSSRVVNLKKSNDNEQLIKDIKEIKSRILNNKSSVVKTLLSIRVVASTEKELRQRVNLLQSKLVSKGFRARVLYYNQEKGLKCNGPYVSSDDELYVTYGFDMLSEGFAASFPFNDSVVNDGKGYIVGKDKKGNIALLDLFSSHRDNNNVLVFGEDNNYFFTKNVLLNFYAQGSRVVVVSNNDTFDDLYNELDVDKITIGERDNGLGIFRFTEDRNDIKSCIRKHSNFIEKYLKILLPDISYVNNNLVKSLYLETITENFYIKEQTNKIYTICFNSFLKKLKLLSQSNIGVSYVCNYLINEMKLIGNNLYKNSFLKLKKDFTILDIKNFNYCSNEVKEANLYSFFDSLSLELKIHKNIKTILIIDINDLNSKVNNLTIKNLYNMLTTNNHKNISIIWTLSSNRCNNTFIVEELKNKSAIKVVTRVSKKNSSFLANMLGLEESIIDNNIYNESNTIIMSINKRMSILKVNQK